MTNLATTILSNSDQLNADDLATAVTIKINGVTKTDRDDQPIDIHYDGDNGKAYRPCLSMRRVLVRAWGSDGKRYAGRSLTLFNDTTVQWGGQAVGGIRISHLSDIDRDLSIPLTVKRGQKKVFQFKRLQGGVTPKAEMVSAEQFIELRDLIEVSGANEEAFLKAYSAERLQEFPAARLQDALGRLRQKLQTQTRGTSENA